ncbi:LOW QUALITY PROTEIN: dual oxidase maturation factor 1-like [Rhinatrema bivittatum]|uniref:LOW QUALITY PROTEIN: dual oxidase maturation factor 1-like n=1 Tax=Rhinatrema bivittatum TaxID=194408 RepID=UPI00112A1089|nr:LOW QUALITY PROTEIN: dual oxidase maturation factor 1-like [Rhinatrema bivittatum]
MTVQDGVFPFFPQKRTPFIFDTQSIEVIIIFLALACTFIIILPGIRGKARPFWLLRVFTSLFIGAVILVTVNFTSDWEVGYISANTTYKAFSNAIVNVDIGLWVGLKGINITLKGNPVVQKNETIDYNEQFHWELTKLVDHDYYESLENGLPNPILYVAEKFTGKSPCTLQSQYRVCAYYTSALMWLAFCTLANLQTSSSACKTVEYGAYMILITAAFMAFSLLSFGTVRHATMCSIKFGSLTLRTVFGGSFWLSLGTSLLCVLIGVFLILMYRIKPKTMKWLLT